LRLEAIVCQTQSSHRVPKKEGKERKRGKEKRLGEEREEEKRKVGDEEVW
jgi:hypothetical protein